MIDIYKNRFVAGNPESFDCFELKDIANSHLLIESHHSKSLRANLHVRFGHLKEFNKRPGSVN